MFKIGDFSQLGQVSVRMLRHYDELGLLKPARVDPFTDYRYYTIEQLPRLHRILALKDLGLPLDQIVHLLDDSVSVTYLQRLLQERQAEIDQRIQEEQARLRRVAARLSELEAAGKPSGYDVLVKRTEPLVLASVRRTVPTLAEMVPYRHSMINDLYGWLDQHSITPAGPEMVLYHVPEYTETDIDMEFAISLPMTIMKQPALRTHAAIQLQALPAVAQVASLIHTGLLREIPHSLMALYRWIGTHDYASSGAYRELHLFGRETEETAEGPVVIELQIPVESIKDTKA